MNPIFSPSLMCLDMYNPSYAIEAFNKHCSMLHVDIMDGHFAPNLALTPAFIKSIRSHTNLAIDAHMMVNHVENYIDALKEAGADYVSVHAEAIELNSFRVIRKILDSGMKLGIVLCPATPLVNILSYIDLVDMLTIMTVEVGYSGQKFIPQMISKILEADKLRKRNSYKYLIQADGAVGKETYKALYEAGTNVFVMGSAGLFKKGSINNSESINAACEEMKREFEISINTKVEKL